MSSCPNCSHPLEGGAKFCPECGVKIAEVTAADTLIGRTLHGKYRLDGELGRGSMGTVYLGEHVGLRKKVALKVLHKDLQLGEEALQRFQREGIAAGRFNHPNAIQIFDFDRDGDLTYLAMEFVEGASLKQLIARQGKLPAEAAAGILRQVLSALAAAHAEGIVHRDLKPENIMVRQDVDGGIEVKVLDFGLSKLAGNRLELSLQTQPGRILGTPLYMAPEQWDGADVDARADLYAAGLIFYEMVSGEQPFQADSTSAALVKKAAGEVPSLRERHPTLHASEELDRFLERAMAKGCDDRYQTAESMQRALDDAIDGELDEEPVAPTARRRVSRPRRSAAPTSSRPAWLVPAAVVSGLVVVSVVGWWALSGTGAEADGGAAASATKLVSAKPADKLSAAEKEYVGRLQAARDHLRNRDARLAIGVLDDAVAMPAADAEAFVLRGDAYRLRRESATAAMDYREALSLWSDYPAANAGLGWVQLEQDQLDEAAESFGRARELDDQGADTLAGLGVVRTRQDRTEDALKLLREAEKLEPRSAPVRYHLGRTLLQAGDLEGATDAFLQSTRNDSRYWPALAGLGEAFERRGRPTDAIKNYELALQQEPDAPEVRERLAALLIAAARFDEAIGHLGTAEMQASSQPELQVLRGLAEQGRGNGNAAITALQSARAAGSRDARAHCVLGALLVQEERWVDAAATFGEAIELDDSLAIAHQNLGLTLMKQARYGEAEQAVKRALELDDGAAFAHLLLGVLHKDYLGDLEQAKKHLGRYRELGGSDPRVADWLRDLGQ